MTDFKIGDRVSRKGYDRKPGIVIDGPNDGRVRVRWVGGNGRSSWIQCHQIRIVDRASENPQKERSIQRSLRAFSNGLGIPLDDVLVRIAAGDLVLTRGFLARYPLHRRDAMRPRLRALCSDWLGQRQVG